MADTETAHYDLVKPEIAGSPSTWGNKLNANFDIIDTALKAISDMATAAMPKAGGAFTGNVTGVAPTEDNSFVRFIDLKNYLINASPKGIIKKWGGTIATIPAGFSLCDGSLVNGVQTPDLRNRFVVGAGSTYNPGAFGGSTTHSHGGVVGWTAITEAQMPYHTHGIGDPTHSHGVSDPGHSHGYNAGDGQSNYGGGPSSSSSPPSGKNTSVSGTGIGIFASFTGVFCYHAGGSQAHNHSIGADNHLPPFYALAYIMRTKYPWEP